MHYQERIGTLFGILIGALTVAFPYAFAVFMEEALPFPVELSPLLLLPPLVILLVAIRVLPGIFQKARIYDYVHPYGFFAVVFVLIFLSGLKIELSPKILFLFVIVFILMSLLGKIREIVVPPLVVFLILHLAFCNISLLSPHPIGIAPTYGNLIELNSKLILVFLVLNALTDNESLGRFLRLYALACILSSLVAIGQILLFYATGINYSFAAEGVNRVFTTPLGGAPRITALFSHPNLLGTAVSPLFMIFLYFFFTREALSRQSRTLILMTLGFMSIPLFFSCSRGTWVAIAAGTMLMFFMKTLHLFLQKILVLALGLLILWLTGVIQFAYEVLVGINPQSVSARYSLFSLGLFALSDYPLIGYGYNLFSKYPGNYGGLSVHSWPVQVLSETGVLGFLTYIMIIGYIIWRVVFQLRRSRFLVNRVLLEAYLVAFVTLLVNNLFHQVAWSNFTLIVFALGEAFARIVRSSEDSGISLELTTRTI